MKTTTTENKPATRYNYEGDIYNYKTNGVLYPFYTFDKLRAPARDCVFFDVRGNIIEVTESTAHTTPLYLNGKPIKAEDLAKALLTAIQEEGTHLASIEQTHNNGVHIALYTRYNNIK